MSVLYTHHFLSPTAGVAVRELSWEESGWDALASGAAPPRAQVRFPTLVNWRLSLTGGLHGQLLFHPRVRYGRQYSTHRIVEVRVLCEGGRPLAFAADGNCFRLDVPEEASVTACREWLAMMLGEGCPLPPLVLRGLPVQHDAFGGMHTAR